jgi:hypothetical protein
MAEIVDEIGKAVASFLVKFYFPWVLADVISWIVSLLFVLARGGLPSLITEAFMDLAIGAIPVPFNLLAIYCLSPLYLILQLVLFAVLFVYFSVETE